MVLFFSPGLMLKLTLLETFNVAEERPEFKQRASRPLDRLQSGLRAAPSKASAGSLSGRELDTLCKIKQR